MRRDRRALYDSMGGFVGLVLVVAALPFGGIYELAFGSVPWWYAVLTVVVGGVVSIPAWAYLCRPVEAGTRPGYLGGDARGRSRFVGLQRLATETDDDR